MSPNDGHEVGAGARTAADVHLASAGPRSGVRRDARGRRESDAQTAAAPGPGKLGYRAPREDRPAEALPRLELWLGLPRPLGRSRAALCWLLLPPGLWAVLLWANAYIDSRPSVRLPGTGWGTVRSAWVFYVRDPAQVSLAAIGVTVAVSVARRLARGDPPARRRSAPLPPWAWPALNFVAVQVALCAAIAACVIVSFFVGYDPFR